MKTLKSISTKMKSIRMNLFVRMNSFGAGAAILLLSIALFFMASCAKEEAIQPSGDSAIQSNGQAAAMRYIKRGIIESTAEINPRMWVFNMIKIDHISIVTNHPKNNLPDYSVTVQSNGTVIFEGRANVKRLGKVTFIVSADELRSLKNFFVEADFFHIQDNLHFIPDFALNKTCYQEKAAMPGTTLIDYDHGYPSELIEIRTRVEEMLNIAQYVKGNMAKGVLDKVQS